MRNEGLLEKFGNIPTPFYYYNLELLERTLAIATDEAQKHRIRLHYALKANSNPILLKLINDQGLGADCVSGNEIRRALSSGFNSKDIVFAGVGKTDEEVRFAIQNNIACFNCESIQEIEVINEIANKHEKTANIALRINPNVNANTHAHITTGLQENKFGISFDELGQLKNLISNLNCVKVTGLHFHIGSQITDLKVFEQLSRTVNNTLVWFEENDFQIKHINLGGGLGIDYDYPDKNEIPPFAEYFSIISKTLKIRDDQQIHLEPGRSIVGQCGSLVSKVMYVKKSGNKTFVIVDAGFTELLRPALYQSFHKMENISSDKEDMEVDIVGPICESTDCFGKAVSLPATNRGDLIIIKSAGAYGEVMASGYNLRTKVKAYYSSDLANPEIEKQIMEKAS